MANEIININDDVAPDYEPFSLSELLTVKDDGTLSLYASHPETSPEALRVLAQRGDDFGILRSVARNPNTPPDVLDCLARSCRFVSVCVRVASNPSTSPDTLTWLLIRSLEESSGDWKECRFNVLSNPHTPIAYILEKMLDQFGERSRLAIRSNSSFKQVYDYAQKQDELRRSDEGMQLVADPSDNC